MDDINIESNPLTVDIDCDSGLVSIEDSSSNIIIKTDDGNTSIGDGSTSVVISNDTDSKKVESDNCEITVSPQGPQGPAGPSAAWREESFIVDQNIIDTGQIQLATVPTINSVFLFINGLFQPDCYTITGSDVELDFSSELVLGESLFFKYQI